MDKIIMKNLSFYGYHGVMQEEAVLGQKFFVDADIYLSLKQAGVSDSVEDTVHYGLAFEVIKDIVENKRYGLLEALAENIAKGLIDFSPMIQEVNVRVRKPEAPVHGIFDYFGVEIRRKRNE